MSKRNNCEELAQLFKALGHPTRLRIIHLLSEALDNNTCVEDIRFELELKQPNISQHLAILRNEKIVRFRRDGNRICYALANKDLLKAIAYLGTCTGYKENSEETNVE